jgi:hypothetical protein
MNLAFLEERRKIKLSGQNSTLSRSREGCGGLERERAQSKIGRYAAKDAIGKRQIQQGQHQHPI